MWGGEPCNFFTPENPEEEVPFCARTIPVDGGFSPASVTRCEAAPDDGQGGGAYLPDPNALPYAPRALGGGGAAQTRLGHGDHRGGGGAKFSQTKGYMVQNEFLNDIAVQA